MKAPVSIISAAILLSIAFSAEATKPVRTNPARLLKDARQERTIGGIEAIDDCFSTMTYRADYRLDKLLERGCAGTAPLLGFIGEELLDMAAMQGEMRAACSAFTCRTPKGDVLFCRNFDYPFKAPSEMLVRVPAKVSGGNASLSVASLNFLEYSEGQLDDGKTDLSKLVGVPYALMDGMNGKGLAICVLEVDGMGAQQFDKSKKAISTSVAMRHVLDHASNVDEAVEIFREHNFFAHGTRQKSSYHFFVADRSGRSVVIEYVLPGKFRSPRSGESFEMKVFEVSSVANNYIWQDWDNPKESHSRDNAMKAALMASKGVLGENQAWKLLGQVAQGHTRWSVIYNLTRRTADITWELSGRTEHFKL